MVVYLVSLRPLLTLCITELWTRRGTNSAYRNRWSRYDTLLFIGKAEKPASRSEPLSTKVAFSTYSYPRSSAYKKGDGAHVDTERCPTYLALPLSTPTSDLMGEGLQPLTGGLERAKVPLQAY